MKANKVGLIRMFVVLLVVAMALSTGPSGAVLAQGVPTDATPTSVPVVPTFADVPAGNWAYNFVETFYHAGMTTGCASGPFRYCPDRPVTRAETAVFFLRAMNGGDYQPPAASGTFADVPVPTKPWMEPWIEEFYAQGLTTGCASDPLAYCPEREVTRAELAVFALRAKYGKDYQPPAVTESSFSDVPIPSKAWMMPWIEEFYKEGLTTGCYQTPTLQYCPERGVTRAEIATFLVRTFGIEDPRGVAAEDFGAASFSGVIGYNVGFHLVDALVSDAASIVVKLYNGDTVLATTTATDKIFTDFPTASQLSAPFDVLGTFDYAADGYWDYSGWSGFTSVIPDKAEITVTFKNGVVRIATNTNLTGDTTLFTKGNVAPEDFSVFPGPEVIGYNVGFHLVDATYADASSVVVKLYNGETVLSTNTATAKFFTDFAAGTIQSSPFDVLGTFDYVADGYWTNSGWNGFTSVIPTKAEITVTFKNGLVKTATNTNLTGDTSPFTKGNVAPEDFSVFPGPVVIGYNVGFHLVDATYADASSVVVKLYKGTTPLATNTATAKFFTDFAAGTIQSSPFDVLGSFDYVTDGYWTSEGWSGFTSDIPTKAEITVTFKNGLTKVATNELLTGDTSLFTKGDVIAQDFGVMNFSGVQGYSVGFGLVDAVASDVDNVVINLYDGTTALATATSTGVLANYPTYTSLSAPFDVLGTFDYTADGNWAYTSWLGLPSTLPSKAEIIVTFKNGLVKTATNTNLTGDVSIFPESPVEYFTGLDFSRTASPALLTSGTRSVSQVRHLDGSVTISVSSADNEYVDSGIVMDIGTLGELDTITINGTGDFSFNLYLDTDKDGEFFLWNPNGSFAGLGNDDYALFQGPYGPTLFADGTSNFGLTNHVPYVNTLDQLKALFPSDTPIGIWIGVTRGNEPAGTKTATISSVVVTTVP